MNKLLEIRDQIDEIDQQIVELYEKRMKLTTEVAAYKIENGKAVFDKERELQKLQKVQDLASSDFTKHGVHELFEHIMSISRKKQYQLLTEHGLAFETHLDMVDEILPASDEAIAVALDSLEEFKLAFPGRQGQICQEELPDMLAGIGDEIHYAFFKIGAPDHTANAIAYYNMIAEAGLYIVKEYQPGPGEAQRCLLVSSCKYMEKEADKLTVCFEAPDECGSLYHLLSHITYNGLNLNRIGSVVIANAPLDYRFFLDLSGNLLDDSILNAIRGLNDEARNFRILGNYR